MNWAVSTLFEKWMEPLEVLAWKVHGRKHDSDRLRYACIENGREKRKASTSRLMIRYAWKTLVENHPHDSICGCSVPEVHKEVSAILIKVEHLIIIPFSQLINIPFIMMGRWISVLLRLAKWASRLCTDRFMI